MRKPWQLDRRTFLQGAGVSCALPFMESMAWAAEQDAKARAKRMCFLYFPNGCSMPNESVSEYADWRWFPKGSGTDYQVTNVLSSLEPHRAEVSVLGGLSHPKSRELLGHIAGDTWLTGGDMRGSSQTNSISVDQFAAQTLKTHTRYPSLVLSADGGVGYKSRASTLSFDSRGAPVPSEHSHRQVFERYFTGGGGQSAKARRAALARGQKVVDMVLEDSKSLGRKLGANDQRKLDEYLTSLNAIEEQIVRDEKWIDIPLPAIDSDRLSLDVDAEIDVNAYVRTTLDLMVLAFELDLTRVASHMLAREDGFGIGDKYPQLALGIKRGHHAVSHDKAEGHWAEWGAYDQWMASHLAYFINELKNRSDAHGPLLDSTMVLYGSACSTTHDAVNYPLVLAGGQAMGLQHGAYHVFDQHHTHMSDLFVSMLNAVDVPTTQFADSKGPLPAVFT